MGLLSRLSAWRRVPPKTRRTLKLGPAFDKLPSSFRLFHQPPRHQTDVGFPRGSVHSLICGSCLRFFARQQRHPPRPLPSSRIPRSAVVPRRHHVRPKARYVSCVVGWHKGPVTHASPPDGRQERVQYDKITARVSRLCYGLDPDHVDPAAITQKVISGVYSGVTTVQLDDLVSRAVPMLVACC